VAAALGYQAHLHRRQSLDFAGYSVAAAVGPVAAEPFRSDSSCTRSGYSASSASTGVFSVFDIATWIALGPSASEHAPWPPPKVS